MAGRADPQQRALPLGQQFPSDLNLKVMRSADTVNLRDMFFLKRYFDGRCVEDVTSILGNRAC